MTIQPAHRIASLSQSDIRHMTRLCEHLGGINLGQGLGDLPAPLEVQFGAITAIRDDRSSYALPEGIRPLRQEIAKKLLRDNGLKADPESQIVVTSGTTGAFAATLAALLNPGDGILLFEPFYGYHLNTIMLSGLEPQFLTLEPPRFALDEERLRAAIRPNTRAIVLCTPSNPSGRMFSEIELRALERVAEACDLLVITDEIYEYITFDGRQHVSPASVGNLGQRTVSIMGFSKTFSVTGWRLGYLFAPEEIARAINLVNDLLYVCAPTPLQYGVAAGLAAPPALLRGIATEYQRKREILCEGLDHAGLTPIVPEGAYYVLADISKFGYSDAKSAALALLEQAGVAAIPGSAFYRSTAGESLIRFCFAKDDGTLQEAAKRLLRFRAA